MANYPKRLIFRVARLGTVNVFQSFLITFYLVYGNGGAVIRTSYLGKFCINSKKKHMKKVASQIDADSTILLEKNTQKSWKKLWAFKILWFKLFQEIWTRWIIFNKDKKIMKNYTYGDFKFKIKTPISIIFINFQYF